MSLLKVARMGHPVLRARAREIERAELKPGSLQKLIDDMIDTMHEYHGVGLAAPQIHESLRIFVAAIAPENDDPLSPDDEPMVFINPVITPAGPEVVETFWFPLERARAGELSSTHVYTREERELVRPCWRFEGRVVWGLTYEILSRLLRATG